MILRALLLILLAGPALAQSRTVLPGELELSVRIENTGPAPFEQEMILLTIHGVYRRHITLENLVQPDLDGFNWMQLGEDYWYESTVDGLRVKNMRRRMALFPQRPGQIEIGAFTHRLTLVDEGDDWFEHEITSPPVSVEVRPAPTGTDWWFPLHRLEVVDNWSNAPDQLTDGAGVLRVIRVEAHGASPDMIPPMPDLHSPSAMIFPHPEKRLVNLSPEGPVSIAFWRWTVQPTNGVSAILEPLELEFYDTRARRPRQVQITAQRVAYSDADPGVEGAQATPAASGPPRTGRFLWLGLIAGLAGLFATTRLRPGALLQNLRTRWQIRRAVRTGDAIALRRVLHGLRGSPAAAALAPVADQLDRAIYGPEHSDTGLSDLGRQIRNTLSRHPDQRNRPTS